MAQAIDGGDGCGQLQRVMLRGNEYRYPQTQAGGTGRGVGEQFQRRDDR
ncbi:Uncharacterised protein [Mycobacteroides abscessus subsp. abscessus]|nr:Uncharacterised protein [Mycobacteroides abscessus subsp. abscessus]